MIILICLEKVYNYASYITVNISSPNTKNLRSLQSGDALTRVATNIESVSLNLAEEYQHYVPLVLKVAPDLTSKILPLLPSNYCNSRLMV